MTHKVIGGRKDMTKSNVVEIIAILWLIAALNCRGVWHWAFITIAIENTIESMVWSYKEHQKVKSAPTTPEHKGLS